MYNDVIDALYSKSDKLNWSEMPCERGELISKEYDVKINGSTLSLRYNHIEKIWFVKYRDFQVNSYDYPLIEKIAKLAEETLQNSKVKKDASNLLSSLNAL